MIADTTSIDTITMGELQKLKYELFYYIQKGYSNSLSFVKLNFHNMYSPSNEKVLLNRPHSEVVITIEKDGIKLMETKQNQRTRVPSRLTFWIDPNHKKATEDDWKAIPTIISAKNFPYEGNLRIGTLSYEEKEMNIVEFIHHREPNLFVDD